MNPFAADPNNPQPTPDNPNPAPVHPPAPPETPQPIEPPGVPPPSPDSLPAPDQEPIQIPPEAPPEVPSEPDSAATPFRTFVVAVASLLFWTGTMGLAAAQTSDRNHDTDRSHPCQVEPDNQHKGAGPNDAEGGNDDADDRSRPSLEDCNGVLVPPKAGDQELEKPAPDTGTTPVIPPGAVPEQSPN